MHTGQNFSRGLPARHGDSYRDVLCHRATASLRVGELRLILSPPLSRACRRRAGEETSQARADLAEGGPGGDDCRSAPPAGPSPEPLPVLAREVFVIVPRSPPLLNQHLESKNPALGKPHL